MEIDILIDELTDCLVERETGKIVITYYKKRETPIKNKDYHGWKFDWSIPDKEGYDIYMNCLLKVIVQYKAESHLELMAV